MRAIPAHTNRAHLPARDRRCDTLVVLNMAARRRPGRRFADMNAVAGRDHDWNLHWPDGPARNGYHYMLNHTGQLVRIPAELRHQPVMEWSSLGISRWRKRVGRRWVGPATVAQRQRQAKRRRVVICWELKSRDYGTPAIARRMVEACRGWTAYFMTLVTMRGWGAKLAAVKAAGGQTALLVHGAVKSPLIRSMLTVYGPSIDRYWGAWR